MKRGSFMDSAAVLFGSADVPSDESGQGIALVRLGATPEGRSTDWSRARCASTDHGPDEHQATVTRSRCISQ
jgi:hypothetical protein